MSTHELQRAMTRLQRALQILAPQIEVAVTKPQIFCRQFVARRHGDWNRRGVRIREQLQCSHVDFNSARRHVGIAILRRPRDDGSLHCNHSLARQTARTLDDVRRRPVRTKGQLHAPGAVAQIDEDETAPFGEDGAHWDVPVPADDVRRALDELISP